MSKIIGKLFNQIIPLVVIVSALGLVVFREHEVAPPNGWPQDIKLYRAQLLAGITTVIDESSGETLFIYLPEYDNHVHPVKIERIDDLHWQVLLEKPEAARSFFPCP